MFNYKILYISTNNRFCFMTFRYTNFYSFTYFKGQIHVSPNIVYLFWIILTSQLLFLLCKKPTDNHFQAEIKPINSKYRRLPLIGHFHILWSLMDARPWKSKLSPSMSDRKVVRLTWTNERIMNDGKKVGMSRISFWVYMVHRDSTKCIIRPFVFGR